MSGVNRAAIIVSLLLCAGSSALGSRNLLGNGQGNNGNGNGNGGSRQTPTTPTTPTASGQGDPLMTTFDGRTFQFMGDVGSCYNIISEKTHQMSMRLKVGVMWDHNGTYMDGIGFRHMHHEVIAELAADDSLEVSLDGKRMQMAANEVGQQYTLGLGDDKMMLMWQLERPLYGQALEITTGMMSVIISVTRAGGLDFGGVPQPGYLNFDASLLGPPAGDMTGVIGESYAAVASGVMPLEAELQSNNFQGKEADYEIASYFDTAHRLNRFGVAADISSTRRRLIERTSVAFPLRCSAGPISRRPLP